ncbi:MAG: 5-formyltetrahydrofolate cyclo-ligase [Candidatus Thermoplasmatota archaeon]
MIRRSVPDAVFLRVFSWRIFSWLAVGGTPTRGSPKPPPQERKTAARLHARAARKAIPAGLRRAKEMRIREALRALPEMQRTKLVGSYVGVHSEVDTRVLIEELLMDRVRVAVPVIESAETMRFAEISSLGSLVHGAHHIPEPPAPHKLVPSVDVVIVPGLLFTLRCERLGNGGGYFDRALQAMPHALRVGLAYDEQIVDELPIESHDEHMDVIVTDERVLRAHPKRSS